MSFCTSSLPAFAGSFWFAVPIFGVTSKIFRNYKIYPNKFVIVSVPFFGVNSKIEPIHDINTVVRGISVPNGVTSKIKKVFKAVGFLGQSVSVPFFGVTSKIAGQDYEQFTDDLFPSPSLGLNLK